MEISPSQFNSHSREQLIAEFVTWAVTHIKGDEKGEAQTFIDQLFRAFGQKGAIDVGGTFEERIKKSAEAGGGTSFADYVWKPIVLIEMKKRGVDLREVLSDRDPLHESPYATASRWSPHNTGSIRSSTLATICSTSAASTLAMNAAERSR